MGLFRVAFRGQSPDRFSPCLSSNHTGQTRLPAMTLRGPIMKSCRGVRWTAWSQPLAAAKTWLLSRNSTPLRGRTSSSRKSRTTYDDDDDVDLFGSSDEEESEEKKRITD